MSGNSTDWIRQEFRSFYEVVSTLLDAANFDRFTRRTCRRYCKPGARGGALRPDTYLRLILWGYLLGLESPRTIADLAARNPSVRGLIGSGRHESPPHHSKILLTRQRVPINTHVRVLTWALRRLSDGGLEKTLQELEWYTFRRVSLKLRDPCPVEACRAFVVALAKSAA